MTEAKSVVASVAMIPVKVIKTLPSGYPIPDPLPWATLAVALSFNPQQRRAAVDVQHCTAT